MFKKFVAYYKPHKKLFFADMTASLFISLIGLVYPIITNVMLNELIPNRKYKLIIAAGAGVLTLYVIRMLLRYFVQSTNFTFFPSKHITTMKACFIYNSIKSFMKMPIYPVSDFIFLY